MHDACEQVNAASVKHLTENEGAPSFKEHSPLASGSDIIIRFHYSILHHYYYYHYYDYHY